ncbi:MAG: HlyD family efflux transporter periplasmic adaptor subunit [Phormidesmis sp. RL_2_1]|nr:HlyD family efflux transporter periplasmic adaptor subunit [Phormidesmis sp. RL_2_1]
MTSTSGKFQVKPASRNGNGNGVNGNGGNGNGGNGHGGNGHGHGGNGNGQGGPMMGFSPQPMPQAVPQSFDKPVILRQSPVWAKWITITIMGVTVASVLAAFLIKVDEAITAQGKLEPEGVVQLVQAPVNGVVDQILVTEGEAVEKGQVVAILDKTSIDAQIKSREEIRSQLQAVNNYYRALQAGQVDAIAPEGVNPSLYNQGRARAQLAASNRLYRAQLTGNTAGLSADQVDQLTVSENSLNSQQVINKNRADQLRSQRTQTKVQLRSAESELATNTEILNSLRELNEKGAVAYLSFLQQQQEVITVQAQVDTLREEIENLTLQIDEAEEGVTLTSSQSDKTLYEQIQENAQRIADIDSQFSQQMAANEQRLTEINGELIQLNDNRDNQALTSPVKGTVFNLKANQAGYVANSTEPMMEIVPEDALVARVFIPSKDIGFVKVGQKVDVRIDAYSFSEFGDMEGTVKSIGTDALPPDEAFPYYRIPASILLDDQAFVVDNTPLAIRSGMSLNANIKLRKRRVITFFTDLFKRKVDAVTTGS